jgi:putative transposase
MIIQKAFRYRIYPNPAQQHLLAVQFGHARFAYNWALAKRQEYYKQHGEGLSYYDTAERLKHLKKDPERVWLKEADSQVLQQKLMDLDRAYVNFFEHRAKYPRFKKRHGQQSIRYPQRFKFNGNRIFLPKVGWVKIVLHRALEGTPKNVTVSKTKSGEYYASVQCDMQVEQPVQTDLPTVGIDLGLKHFAVLSTGEKIEHPQYLRQAEKRLARLQRRLSRKKKGSANRDKARLRVARQNETVARQRKDFLDKLSYRMVTEHGLVKIETLNVKGMVRNHSLAKSISDSGWGAFGRMCEYKAPWHGSALLRIGRFFPSSKVCHVCGLVNEGLTLADRVWTCEGCGTEHDRDHNAAINIKLAPIAGAAKSNACGDRVRRKSLRAGAQRSLKQEAQEL